jgi:hypothetical protein
MASLLLLLSHLSSLLLVSFLMLSTHLLWAQGTSTRAGSVIPLSDAPSAVQTRLHFTDERFSPVFAQNRDQTESWLTFFPNRTAYDRRSGDIDTGLGQDGKTIRLSNPNGYFSGGVPAKWTTFGPTFADVHHETTHGIPWAGPIILRIGQEAKAHPHITTVLKTVHPRF